MVFLHSASQEVRLEQRRVGRVRDEALPGPLEAAGLLRRRRAGPAGLGAGSQRHGQAQRLDPSQRLHEIRHRGGWSSTNNFDRIRLSKIQCLSDNMTLSGIGKSVIQTDCLINQSFLVQDIHIIPGALYLLINLPFTLPVGYNDTR